MDVTGYTANLIWYLAVSEDEAYTPWQFSYGNAWIPSLSRFGGSLCSAKPTCTQVHYGSNIFEIWYFSALPKSYPNSPSGWIYILLHMNVEYYIYYIYYYPPIRIIITYVITLLLLYIYIAIYIYTHKCWMCLLFNMWIEPIKTWMSDKFTKSYGIFCFCKMMSDKLRNYTHKKKKTSSPINLIRLVYAERFLIWCVFPWNPMSFVVQTRFVRRVCQKIWYP